MAEEWTRERLQALVAGREVNFTDRTVKSLPVPEWILAEGAYASVATTGQRVAATHPDDRQAKVDSWWEAVRKPGEVVEQKARIRIDGQWTTASTIKVALFDHPDVGAMIEAICYGRTVDVDDFDEVVQSGEFEETRWLIHTVDETAVILATEGMVEEITGRRPEDVIGEAVINHLHPDGFEDALTLWMEVQNGPPGTMRSARQRVLRPDGSTIWVEATTIKRMGENGEGMATILVHDATDRRRKEAALRTSQHEFRLLADQVPAAVFRADANQRITFRNQRWRTDIDGDEPVDHLADLVHIDDRARHDEQLRGLSTGSADASAAYEVRSADGERILAITCRSVLDLVNERRSYVGSVIDVTDTVRLRARADRDSLTGLWNRRYTEERLDEALAEDPEGTRVVFVDLDGFKGINDTFGHNIGDLVLQAVAERLQASMRPDDVVCRFGGDEFVIVIRDADHFTDSSVMARLDDALADPIFWPGGSWSPQGSIGIARGRAGEDAADLVTRADHEMFADKRRRKAVG